MTTLSPSPRLIAVGVLVQALATIVGALVITFSSNHAPVVGAGALAVTALGMTIGQVVLAVGAREGVTVGVALWIQSAGTAAAAVAAGAFWAMSLAHSPSLADAFVLTVAIWSGLMAVTQAVAGWKVTNRPLARDFFVLAVMSGITAIVEGTLPLTDVFAVGIVGAYFAVFGVYAAIAGFTLWLGTRPRATAAKEMP